MINLLTNQPPFDGSILTYFIAQLYVPSTLSLNRTKVINLIYLPDKDVFVEYYTTKKIERLVKWTTRYTRPDVLMFVRVFNA